MKTLPWLGIVPYARNAIFVRTLAVGPTLPIRIDIPDNAVLMRLMSNGFCFATDKGNASNLTSAQAQAAGNDKFSVSIMLNSPNVERNWYYCGHLRSVSLFSTQTNLFMGAKFITRDQIPTI